VRPGHLFFALLLVAALGFGAPYAALLLNSVMGPWSADAIEQDGSVTHMTFDRNMAAADFVPLYPGAAVVQGSRLVSRDAPGGFSSLELAVRASADEIRDFYRSRLVAAGFTVEDLGTQGLNAAAAAYLGVAGTLAAQRPPTDDAVVVQISTEEGLVMRSRLVKVSWRKLSEWPKGQRQP
jgi:hypothetical protein